MAQHVENNSLTRAVVTLLIGVVTATLIGAGAALIASEVSYARLDQRVTDGFCMINSRLDQMQNHPARSCPP